MRKTIRKLILTQRYCYTDLEYKLEQQAEEGLFLTKISNGLYHFEKSTPRKVSYTVTFFQEGSSFQGDCTEHQQTFLDYAAAAGWTLVATQDQMHIFKNETEHPVPFDIDPAEKLRNIQACMNKGFLAPMVMLMALFGLILYFQIDMLFHDPLTFFSSMASPIVLGMLALAVISYCYPLWDYFHWCHRCKQSLAQGGALWETPRQALEIYNTFSFVLTNAMALWIFFDLCISKFSPTTVMALLQVPMLIFFFQMTKKVMKGRKTSTYIKEMVSYSVLILVAITYGVGMYFLSTTTSWASPVAEIPSMPVYDSVFLTQEVHGDRFSLEDTPQGWAYTILTPKSNLVYNLVAKDLKHPTEPYEMELRPMAEGLWGATETYGNADGAQTSYVLFYPDQIIRLEFKMPPSPEEMAKLQKEIFS